MADPRRENRFTPALTRLVGALETELPDWGISTCFLGLVAGTAIDPLILGDGSQGDAVWVRMGEVVPTFQSEGQLSAECGSKLRMDLEVGFITCYPLDGDGDALTADQNIEIADHVNAAMLALYTTLGCRPWRKNDNGTEVDFQITRWAPAGPIGASIGGAWYLQIIA